MTVRAGDGDLDGFEHRLRLQDQVVLEVPFLFADQHVDAGQWPGDSARLRRAARLRAPPRGVVAEEVVVGSPACWLLRGEFLRARAEQRHPHRDDPRTGVVIVLSRAMPVLPRNGAFSVCSVSVRVQPSGSRNIVVAPIRAT
jgi:hypothetical protein